MQSVAGSTSLQATVDVLAKAQEQQKVQGQDAVKLIESANTRPLPPDATYSTRA